MTEISGSCQQKEEKLKALFANCKDSEAKYHQIMELGRSLKLDAIHKTDANQVSGCQSLMYLHSYFEDNKVYFEAASDALISAGLAAILIAVYSGESPEVILKHPPSFIQELGLATSVTPSRANGLYSIHLRMKQDALRYLMKKN